MRNAAGLPASAPPPTPVPPPIPIALQNIVHGDLTGHNIMLVSLDRSVSAQPAISDSKSRPASAVPWSLSRGSGTSAAITAGALSTSGGGGSGLVSTSPRVSTSSSSGGGGGGGASSSPTSSRQRVDIGGDRSGPLHVCSAVCRTSSTGSCRPSVVSSSFGGVGGAVVGRSPSVASSGIGVNGGGGGSMMSGGASTTSYHSGSHPPAAAAAVSVCTNCGRSFVAKVRVEGRGRKSEAAGANMD